MDTGAWTPSHSEPVVGVVVDGGEPSADSELVEGASAVVRGVEDAVREAGGSTVVGSAERTLDDSLDFVVAVGRSARNRIVQLGPEIPILLATAETHRSPSIEGDAVATAVRAVLDGTVRTERRDLLDVTAEADRSAHLSPRVLFDVTLVTEEPATISEFAVELDGELVDRVRADGLVVATPFGSHGYAASAGGSRLHRKAGCVSVVPIAPFVTETRTWVLPVCGLSVTVVRDEGDVSLCLDGEVVDSLSNGEGVTLATAGSVDVLRPPGGDG